MKLSLFTPTNDVTHLFELYDSLRLQCHDNWEWVLVPNEKVQPTDIPKHIRVDKRVKVVQYQAKNIGALKRFACDNCTGDAFLEMDHDDILVPGALRRINACFEAGAGFVHSDDACFTVDRHGRVTPHAYDPAYGWEPYNIRVYGTELIAMRSFPPDARSLCEINNAPDHMRAWSRKAYYRAGGHDRHLLAADDHDLLCRTYLTGCEWKHTGHCDYLYRFHPKNSVKRYHDQIWDQQAKNRDKYIMRLIDEWVRRTNGTVVDYSDPKRLAQVRKRLPYLESTVSVVRSTNLLPWLTYDEAFAFSAEVHRILKPGGWFIVRSPAAAGNLGFMPGYKSWWHTGNLKCLTEQEVRDLHAPKSQARFCEVRLWEYDSKPKHTHVCADLQAIKPGHRMPGKARI